MAAAWRQNFEASFRERNAVHESFRSVVQAQGLLARQNVALKRQKESAEKQLLILQHEHAGSAGSAAVQQLEATVRSLQADLLAKAKVEAGAQDARYRLLAAETNLGECSRTLEALRKAHADLKAEAERCAGSEKVLQKEVRRGATSLELRVSWLEQVGAPSSECLSFAARIW